MLWSTSWEWVVLDRAAFPMTCGFIAPDGFNAGGACAIRLQQGVVVPTDVEIATGALAGQYKIAPLCVIHGTMSAEEAGHALDMYAEGSLRDHELRHCKGEVHQ